MIDYYGDQAIQSLINASFKRFNDSNILRQKEISYWYILFIIITEL